MAERKLKVWYDAEGDFLEVIFDQKPGYVRETANEAPPVRHRKPRSAASNSRESCGTRAATRLAIGTTT